MECVFCGDPATKYIKLHTVRIYEAGWIIESFPVCVNCEFEVGAMAGMKCSNCGSYGFISAKEAEGLSENLPKNDGSWENIIIFWLFCAECE